MGFELLSDAFSSLGKKYHPYLNQNSTDPMLLLVSQSSNTSLDMNASARLLISVKIRKSIREIQLKQQNIIDKMCLESNNGNDYLDQIEDLATAIENVTAIAGSIHYANGIQREHDLLIEREGLMKLKIVL